MTLTMYIVFIFAEICKPEPSSRITRSFTRSLDNAPLEVAKNATLTLIVIGALQGKRHALTLCSNRNLSPAQVFSLL